MRKTEGSLKRVDVYALTELENTQLCRNFSNMFLDCLLSIWTFSGPALTDFKDLKRIPKFLSSLHTMHPGPKNMCLLKPNNLIEHVV